MKEKNVCKGLKFSDCELAILRIAVDKAEEKIGKRIVHSEDIKHIIEIVENFIKKKNKIVALYFCHHYFSQENTAKTKY